MKIFVGNLSFKSTEHELQKEFEAFGEVNSVKIIVDHETLKSRGFAFVEMLSQDQALAAIAGLNGKDLAGQILKVNEARPREDRGGPGRERTGGGYGAGARPSSGGYGSGGRSSGGGFGNRGRSGGYDGGAGDTSIYDTKGGTGGGSGKRGRGGRGPGSGGRSGGGRRSPH